MIACDDGYGGGGGDAELAIIQNLVIRPLPCVASPKCWVHQREPTPQL